MPSGYTSLGGLHVRHELADVVSKVLAPAAGVSVDKFWNDFGSIIRDLAPRNAAFMRKRDAMQAAIDAWLLERTGQPWDAPAYRAFLCQIGYIVPTKGPFQAATANVDDAIKVAGPQLVVPVDNARYALNAANARWGSLLDAFYGTTAGPPQTPGLEKGKAYNPKRGAAVFTYAQAVLDGAAPLANGCYDDIVQYTVAAGKLTVLLKSGATTGLKDASQFVGYNNARGSLSSVLLRKNGLHIDIIISKQGPGATHPASVSDIQMESALTAIMDCEDSVAAVDAADKALVYSNWGRLMQSTLSCRIGAGKTRTLNPDRSYTAPGGGALSLPGRALMLVRNVGLHVYSDACLTAEGRDIPESIMDCMLTALGALPDLLNQNKHRNSYQKSMYIVRPKMHGPDEVAFVVEMFERVEAALGLPALTLKLGIMDEERRTTVNLSECIRVAKERVIFINTGFLDRTGDEIHTSFLAGPVLPKSDIKTAAWRVAYEDWNVDVGIACGLLGCAQIGKGMWAKPDELGEMLKTKVQHPQSGATTAWVPSPTAATLHAIHYHQVDVAGVQARLKAGGPRAKLDDILTPALLDRRLTSAEITMELENNAQGILGYVVRWVQQGVGCSKVPDINDIGLMEDRATLRIASQHIANWMYHGICSQEQVVAVMKNMAAVVDRQNEGDKLYRPMAPSFSNNAWKGALELVLGGKECPNGYTEFALIKWRRDEKKLSSPVVANL